MFKLLLAAAIHYAHAQGQCSLRSNPKVCASDVGCIWCAKYDFCTTAGSCPLAAGQVASSAQPTVPSQYSCNISTLSIDGNDPRPDFESSFWRWDVSLRKALSLGGSGPSEGMLSITTFENLTEYVITTVGFCQTADALPMGTADPFAWVAAAKLVGQRRHHGIACNQYLAQEIDPATGQTINMTIWLDAASGYPVGAYKEYPRATPSGNLTKLSVHINYTSWESAPQPVQAFALPKSCFSPTGVGRVAAAPTFST